MIDRLALTGMMGAGKSEVGRILAARLSLPFLDLDRSIVEGEGRSIASIFEEDGEERFRSIETDYLVKVVGEARGVLATGGGVVLSERNRELLSGWGSLVYLKATARSLFSRLDEDERGVRPLLAGGDPAASLESLLSERAPLYEKADLIIDTDHLSVEETVERILRVFK